MKRALSLILVLAMLSGMMPMQVFATEGTQETEVVVEPTETIEAPEEETTAPPEETEEIESSESSEPEEEVAVVHEHEYTAEVTPPTCTDQGYTTYTCICGDSYTSDYVDAVDHSYANGTCTVCGATSSQYLQQLPENITGCSNLYDILTPTKGYYTATKYDTSNGAVLSVVIPVEPGDRIAASSFGPVSENKGSVNGIRVTYLLGDQIVTSLSAGDVYDGYMENGYITVPEGIDAVCVPWWKPMESNWLTLSQISKNFASHSPKSISAQAPTCTENGYTAGEVCDICDALLGSREEIPATGHDYNGDICTICGTVNVLAILDGKYVSILGDSISTFNGYSNDATVNTTIGGNGPRYDAGTADTKPGSYCLLESVNDTWWMHFANRSGMKLLVNNSWAGSQVFGGKTSDGRVIPAAYLERCVNLHDNTVENNTNNVPINPDVIFVYLGINDYNFNRSNVGNGTVDYAALINSDGTYVTPTTFGEAYGILMHKMQQAYPNAQIFAMTLLPENLYSVDMTAWEQHNAYIRAAAEYYDVPVVDLAEKCAITWDNYSAYMMDRIHPTTAGMELISDCIEAELVAYYTGNSSHTHSYTPTVTAPTCTEEGYTTYTCICGDSYVDDYVDAEGEHDFTDWYTTKEAAYNADGEESRDCKKCSHVEFRSVKLEVVTSGNVGKGTPYTDDVTYTLYADGTMVISGKGIVYCSDWRGDYQPYKDYRTQVKTLIVEEGITTTAGGCFAHFYNLETVSLPDSLTKIDGNAFMSSFSSSITSIVIPKTVTYIGAYSYGFYYGKGGTTFTDIIIENPNVRFVDNKAVFNSGNNLENLTLYSYGTSNNVIAYAQKYGCKYVDLEAYKTGIYSGVEYMYYDGVLTLSAAQSDATIAGEDAPWNAEKNNIQKIVIESGITSIAANAFKDYYNLEYVVTNNEICYVGDGAFATTENCDRTLTLALPRTVKSVGEDVFAGRQNVTLTAYLGSAAAEINAPGVKLNLKKQFKLLLIGNSYSEDASSCGQGMQDSQLLNMLQAMLGEDAEVTVALLSSGGKGINWHATQAEQGNAAYSFKIISSNSPTWTTIGSASSYQALTWTDWDVVSLQPYNISASTGIEAVPYPDGTDMKFRDLKTASEYLLDYIGTHAPDADIYCYMHWSQTTGTTLNANLSHYNRFAKQYLGMMEHEGTTTGTKYTSLIPVGLSIQNARSTYLALLDYNTDTTLNLTTDTQMGLQRDGGHLSFNVGRYIAGLTFAEMIVPEDWRADNYVLPEIRITESVGKLPKEYSVIAQKAVLAAVSSWKNGSLVVTNIDGYTQDPTVAASELLKATQFRLNNKEESLMAQLESAVLAVLPADFAVSKIEINEDAMTADVTIRFGYTFATVTVSYAKSVPVITQQPESVEQEIGKKFAITVKAEGEGLTYQWYVKEAGAKTFKASVNKTASYAYTMQSYMNNRQVYCVVTDAYGNQVTTETATITLPPVALKITEQPKDARVNVGEKFSISPKVEGEGLTYQWYVKESGAKAFKVSSVKGSAYALTMQKYMIGRQVYCVITDKHGNTVTTDVATISLPPVELKILTQPVDAYASVGTKFSISPEVQGDGLTYQWYYKESYQKNFSASSNKTPAYAYTMQSYMNGRSVYCVITDQYGKQVTTETVTIHITQ